MPGRREAITMTAGIWHKHEARIRKTLIQLGALLMLAILATIVPLFGAFKPVGELLGVWWQRGGAPTVVFAFLAHNKAQYLGALLTPGSFTSDEMESLRSKYKVSHQLGTGAAAVLTVSGTVVWGYGDLLLNWFGRSFY